MTSAGSKQPPLMLALECFVLDFDKYAAANCRWTSVALLPKCPTLG